MEQRWWDRLGVAMLAVGLAAGGMAAPADARAQGSADALPELREHRWRHRVLLVFAPAPDLAAYGEQMARLAEAAPQLEERDVRVASVLDAGGSAPQAGSALTLPALPPARARALRRRLGVPAGEFRVVLVGKDGGAKLARRTPLTASTLLSTIDGMPVGAAEARGRARRSSDP